MVVVNRMRGVARHLGHVLDGERHGEPFMLYMRIPSKPVICQRPDNKEHLMKVYLINAHLPYSNWSEGELSARVWG